MSKEHETIRPSNRRGNRDRGPQVRVNNRIRAREVRVVDGRTNQQIGIMNTQDALRAARQVGLDLVEVAPQAKPPVCRIVDFGKYRYEMSKQDKERKASGPKVKEVKFRVNIDEHDYMTKLRRAEDFLAKGSKVRVQLQFRGRENAHQELGFELLGRVREDLVQTGNVEMEPRKVGRAITMVLSPLPENKRKRRWTSEDEEFGDEDGGGDELEHDADSGGRDSGGDGDDGSN